MLIYAAEGLLYGCLRASERRGRRVLCRCRSCRRSVDGRQTRAGFANTTTW